MARQCEIIRTESYIHAGGCLVPVDSLSEKQRATVATTLSQIMLGVVFAGRAVFDLPETAGEGFGHATEKQGNT